MLVDSIDSFREVLLPWLASRDTIAVDTETTGLRPYNGDRVVGVSLGDGESSFYVPFRHEEGTNLPGWLMGILIQNLQPKTLIFHNAKFDLHMLANEGLDVSTLKFEDTLLGMHLINEQEESLALKPLCDKYGLLTGSKDEDELREHVQARTGIRGSKQWKGHMWKLPADLVSPYACTDADLTWALWTAIQPGLDTFRVPMVDDDAEGLYRAEVEYLRVVFDMERRGLLLDMATMDERYSTATARKMELLIELQGMVGRDNFNPNSPVQLVKEFGWANSRAETLEELGTPEAELVLEYRAYYKAITSYYDVYRARVDDHDVLRPDFRMTGTETGRLSCTNPNLQAVPRYNERQPIKDVFVAREGYNLIELDLSQAELRVMAYYANCAAMMDIFAQGRDLHTETANNMGMPRDIAKRINLSSVYGIGAAKFANTYKVPEADATRWLNTYHAGYPEVKQFYHGMRSQALRDRYIELPTGRRRRYNKPYRNEYGVGYGEQKASSNFIQGTVGEIMRIAMLRVAKDPNLEEAHMLLTVHDSLLVEVPEDWDMAGIARYIATHMTDFGELPLAADAKGGKRWGNLEGLSL